MKTRSTPALRWTVSLLAFVAALSAFQWLSRRTPMQETEIYRGVFYGCKDLEPDELGRGLMHYVRVDLTAPGIELYVTPMDEAARQEKKLYRLRHVSAAARAENLAVAVNGVLFHAHTRIHHLLPIPGDLADWTETLVSDGQVNLIHPHSYLLWFDADLTPTMEFQKPPRPGPLSEARWAVSGQKVLIYQGEVRGGSGRIDRTTLVGVDRKRKQLFLAVCDASSHARGSYELARLGATDAIFLDGGVSTSMVLGPAARHVRSGTVLGGWRPVATQFGVRAQPLD